MRKGRRALLMLGCSMAAALLMILWPLEKGIEVETGVIQRGQLVESVVVNGMVRYEGEQPLFSLKNGIVNHVYVQPGQQVQQGELLFKMDTTSEEQALAALYEWKHALSGINSAVGVLTLQNEWEIQSNMANLLASIEASCIRAPQNGVMEAVYAKEGEYSSETTLLGMIRGSEKQLTASAVSTQMTGVTAGNPASAKINQQTFPVILTEISPPDSNGLQTLVFEAGSSDVLREISSGERAEIEILTNAKSVSALIPLSAIDPEGGVWVVENGRAYQRKIKLDRCSSTQASAEVEWADQRVILFRRLMHWRMDWLCRWQGETF